MVVIKGTSNNFNRRAPGDMEVPLRFRHGLPPRATPVKFVARPRDTPIKLLRVSRDASLKFVARPRSHLSNLLRVAGDARVSAGTWTSSYQFFVQNLPLSYRQLIAIYSSNFSPKIYTGGRLPQKYIQDCGSKSNRERSVLPTKNLPPPAKKKVVRSLKSGSISTLFLLA